jgi:DNA repair protein RadD
MMPVLRDYQREAIDAINKYLNEKDGQCLCVVPTGGGKALIIAAFMKELLEQYPDCRIAMLSHRKELLSQNYQELINLWPEAPATLYSAGLGSKNITGQILIAGIQSIHRHAARVQACHLVLIDEAHLLSFNQSSMYRKFLSELNDINCGCMKVVGFTATPFRMSDGLLYEGEDRIFTDICYNVPILDLINRGFLAPVVPLRAHTQLDTTGVGTRNGEFIPSQLQAAADKEEITRAAVAEIVHHGASRKSWVAFCTGVAHAEHVRDEIRRYDISCEMVTGDTEPVERDRIIRDFKSGKIRCLTNVEVLTTGFNAPCIDLIAMLCPTKSPAKYVQVMGRGTRTAPGKTDCLVLDFSGTTSRFGPIDMVNGKSKMKGSGGETPIKKCPVCETEMYISARACDNCGHEFEINGSKLDTKASTSPLLSNQIIPTWEFVDGVTYARHVNRKEPDKPNTLRISYMCGMTTYSEWKAFDHPAHSGSKRMADKWWLERGQAPAPANLDEALKRVRELRQPSEVQVRPKPGTKFHEVMAARF